MAAKLTRKELEKLALQTKKPAERGPIWHNRPTVMDNKKYNKKSRRSEGKALCRAFA